MFVVPIPKYLCSESKVPLASQNSCPVFGVTRSNLPEHIIEIIREHFQQSFKCTFTAGGQDVHADFLLKLICGRDASNFKSAESLNAEEQKFILNLESDQGYVLRSCQGAGRNIIILASPSKTGILYAAMTLKQLIVQADGKTSCPSVIVRDYPDHEFRVASRWLLCGEACRWSYDWGDGRDNLIKRFKDKIDRCLDNKSNMVFFDGFDMRTDKYPDYSADMRMLNNYAIARGVKLVFGCYGIGVGGWGSENILAEAHNFVPGAGKSKNRKNYPDGELYPCCGNNPKNLETRYNGTCRSNGELNEIKKRDIAEYVRIIQPGALYIHHEDLSNYDEGMNVLWAQRCQNCREKWPDDRLEKINGGASGIAHGYNKLCEAVFSVKDPTTGYDASRDCVIVMASPTYGEIKESDENWDKIVEYWTNISKEMNFKNNVLFCFREQFWRHDNNRMRIKELAESLDSKGQGHGIFLFSVSGADLYLNNALFSAGPVLNSFFEGATAIGNFSGIVFQDLQELFNSEYQWNLHSTTFSEIPASYNDAFEKYIQYTERHYIPAELSREEGFIEECCQSLYGNDAGRVLKQFYLLGSESNEFPLTLMYYPFSLRKLFVKSLDLKAYDIEAEKNRWKDILGQTNAGLTLVAKALKCTDLKVAFRSEFEYLEKCMHVGQMFADIVFSVFTQDAHGEVHCSLQTKIGKLETYIADQFQFEFSSPGNGDMELWPVYIDRLKKVVEVNFGRQSGKEKVA